MLLFTAFALLVWRLGVKIKVPLFDVHADASGSNNLFGFLDIFTGGALSQFSILALGISPYITASIVIQLLQMDIVPYFTELKESGAAGRQKINQINRAQFIIDKFKDDANINLLLRYINEFGNKSIIEI